jgi:hypothetical protein
VEYKEKCGDMWTDGWKKCEYLVNNTGTVCNCSIFGTLFLTDGAGYYMNLNVTDVLECSTKSKLYLQIN